MADLRREFEERTQVTGRQLRIEKILYSGKEGKTSTGCPLAKWVIRRADPEEKILVVVKKRPGHRLVTNNAIIIYYLNTLKLFVLFQQMHSCLYSSLYGCLGWHATFGSRQCLQESYTKT